MPVHQLSFSSDRDANLRSRKRKKHNQYFTPEFVVEKALSKLSPELIYSIIDPAVGNGIFLKVAGKRWQNAKLVGIDIDSSIIKTLKQNSWPNSFYLGGNSLEQKTWNNLRRINQMPNGGFDLVVGNPPFSSWFHRIEDKATLSSYALAHKNEKLMKSQAIEILFLEIFINLAKELGNIVIVVPDGILSNPKHTYVREFILSQAKVEHIMSLPRNTFEQTSAKTSIIILTKKSKKRISHLNYFARFSNFEKNGSLDGQMMIPANALARRMDYSYYSSVQHDSTSELRDKGYRFAALSKYTVYCKTGKTLYGKKRKFSGSGIKFLHATNITELGINYHRDKRFIDPLSPMYFPGAYAKKGDIIFVRVGVGCAGRAAIVMQPADEGQASDYLHLLRVQDISPYFLVVYLKTKFGLDSINLLKHGVGTISINKTDLLSLPIPIVPTDLQLAVEKRYKSLLSDYRASPYSKQSKLASEMAELISILEQRLSKGGLLRLNQRKSLEA